MKNTFLFDLDGTLLPMDFKKFMKLYLGSIGNYFKEIVEPQVLIDAILKATEITVKTNDGRLNEEIFMIAFNEILNIDMIQHMEMFTNFYDSDFINCKAATYESEYIVKSINLLKEKGYEIAIATNPLLPLKSNHHRVRWAGLNPSDFSYISSFEGNSYCKPFALFYEEVLENINKTPEECYMVGNDVSEDIAAGLIGIETYLITDHMLNFKNVENKADQTGTYEDFYNFVLTLEDIN